MVKKLAVLDVNKCIGCMECMFACTRRVGRAGFDKSAIRVRSAGGIERGFVVVVWACIMGAIFWDDELDKPIVCKYCGDCADYCVHNAIGLVDV
jgi:ferredoxin